jgi:hypothetical protein
MSALSLSGDDVRAYPALHDRHFIGRNGWSVLAANMAEPGEGRVKA